MKQADREMIERAELRRQRSLRVNAVLNAVPQSWRAPQWSHVAPREAFTVKRLGLGSDRG